MKANNFTLTIGETQLSSKKVLDDKVISNNDTFHQRDIWWIGSSFLFLSTITEINDDIKKIRSKILLFWKSKINQTWMDGFI